MRKLLLIGTCLVALTGAAHAAADTDWKKTPVEKACTDTPLAELTDAQRIDGISACTRAIASTSNPNALSTLYAWRAELYTQLHGCATDPTQKGPPASSCEYDRAIADYAKAIENLLRVDDGYAARFLSNLKGWLEFMKVDVNAATRSFAYAAGGKYDRSSTFWLARSYYEKGDLANARVQFSKALKDGKPEDEVKYLAQSKEYSGEDRKEDEMKTLLITTALVGLTLSAHAQAPVTLDESAIGTWCRYAGSEKSGFYQREVNPPKNKAPCKGEDWMIVKWDGYEGGEFSCKSTSVEDMNDVKPNSKHYRIAYRCRGEGSSWREKCIMFLPHIPGKELDGKLIIHCEK